jgi:hypothetical protein
MQENFILTKDGEIYDLKMEISKVSEEEILYLKLSKENVNDYFFTFSGTITNLIDQDGIWKKFELDEIKETVTNNCKQKKVQMKISEDSVVLIFFFFDVLGKTKEGSIKLSKKLQEKTKTDEVNGVSAGLLESILNEFSLLRRNKKVCLYHWTIEEEEIGSTHNLDFNYDMKFSSNVEFIFEFKLTTTNNTIPRFKIHLETENTDTLEKQNYFIYNNFYYCQNSNNGYQNHAMEKVKHIVTNFKRGNYKMRVIFSVNNIKIWIHYFKLFMKIRN